MSNPGAETAGLSVPALHRQITGHLKWKGLTMVVAYTGGTAVAFGYAFPCTAEYWFGDPFSTRCPKAPAPSG
ncbi:hypothetical protein OHT76_43120 [Streptomyces sp. NBC_00287]|uniref:hypothetical protein n=1 Tax=Streptomyces sp. NBC_00287 TaxID=2975702 RepID=UPI002E2DC44C|nr:hypothetical protein [Streptomyces sp. NBC_00287]